jgi:hypothetical protein
MRLTSFHPKMVVAIITGSLLLQGCSYKAWYGGLQQKQRQDCYERGNQSDIQSCLEKANLNYEQYKSSREDALKK